MKSPRLAVRRAGRPGTSADWYNWFNSYLASRAHTVHLQSGVSDTVAVHCGVPQGLSLGPKIFITYTEEIDEMFQNHKFNHHCFADDTQAYVDVPQSQVGAVASRIQNCPEDVANWSGARRLQLNPGKTNIMWFGSSTLLQCLSSK